MDCMGKLIWLASYPKSGNTWMRAFLTNLMTNAERPVGIDDLGTLAIGDSEPGRYETLSGKQAADLTPDDVAALRPRVHAQIAAEHPDTRFAKIHSAMMQLAGQPTVNMAVTAGAIYIARNPLDVAVSFSHHLGAGIDDIIELMGRDNALTDSTGVAISELIGSWSQHVLSWTAHPSPGLHVVRYEDMLAKPQKTFGGVVKFLGLDAPRCRIERAIHHASFKVLRNQEDKSGFRERSEKAERFFRSGRAGGWRDALSSAQVEAITERHREQMARFGYLDALQEGAR
tara:strand:- start:116 stop:973 length:858 start_codon:yes stop_codon:yes gene_type:complete